MRSICTPSRFPDSRVLHTAAAIILVMIAACRSTPTPPADSPPELQLVESKSGSGIDAIAVAGLPAEDLDALASAHLTPEAWSLVLRVTADGAATDLPAVAGSYHVAGGVLRFIPDFPLDPHVSHRVVFDPSRLPRHADTAAEPWRTRSIERAIAAETRTGTPSTQIVDVFPRDVLLENQLRIYVQFSAPMSMRRANDFVRLLDDAGREVDGAFLPLDVSFWNADRTRYTLLFDPGRVKRGILPNMELGRPLVPGKRYTLEIDREWPDARGQPLVDRFRRDFRVEPALFTPIDPSQWRLQPPTAGTRTPLAVAFPRPLDHAIVAKALYVIGDDGKMPDGAVSVNDQSTVWTFVPREPWAAGSYRLATRDLLEDPAGNRVGRAFDFDPRRPAGGGDDTHAEARIPFVVLPAR